MRTTSNLCNTLVASYILPKLELIIDKEKPTSHAALVSLIEHRLGDNERPPDTKVWSKGRGLTDVSRVIRRGNVILMFFSTEGRFFFR